MTSSNQLYCLIQCLVDTLSLWFVNGLIITLYRFHVVKTHDMKKDPSRINFLTLNYDFFKSIMMFQCKLSPIFAWIIMFIRWKYQCKRSNYCVSALSKIIQFQVVEQIDTLIHFLLEFLKVGAQSGWSYKYNY